MRSGCGVPSGRGSIAILNNADIAAAIGLRPDRVQSIWSQFLQGSRRINMQHPFALYVLIELVLPPSKSLFDASCTVVAPHSSEVLSHENRTGRGGPS